MTKNQITKSLSKFDQVFHKDKIDALVGKSLNGKIYVSLYMKAFKHPYYDDIYSSGEYSMKMERWIKEYLESENIPVTYITFYIS